MKLLTSENYFHEVNLLFKRNEDTDIAVAFLGYDILSTFENRNTSSIRLICNLESGACNPNVIKKLLAMPNIEIKTNAHLHAKCVIQDNAVIIGSANFSANGLALEGNELSGWSELGIMTNNNNIIDESKAWFSNLWEQSHYLTNDQIEERIKAWDSRRNNRPHINLKKSLINAAIAMPEIFKDRKIYIVIYYDDATPEALAEFERLHAHKNVKNTEVDFYEDWLELPDDAHVISIRIGSKEGINFDGLFYMPKEPIISRFTLDNGCQSNIKICTKSKSIIGYKLSSGDKVKIKPIIKRIINENNKKATIVPFMTCINELSKY